MLTLHADVNDLPDALRRLWTARDLGGAWRLALELPDEEQTAATRSLLVAAACDGDAEQTDFRRIADVLERTQPADPTLRDRFQLALALARCNAYRRALALFEEIPLDELETDEAIVAREEMLRLRIALFSPKCSDEEFLPLFEPLMRPEAKLQRLAVLRQLYADMEVAAPTRSEAVKEGIRRLLTLTDDLTPEERCRVLRMRIRILDRMESYMPPVLDDCFRLLREFPESDEAAVTAFELVQCLLLPDSAGKPIGSSYAWAGVETGFCPDWANEDTKLFYRVATDVIEGALKRAHDTIAA